jgi:hypothetical protein
MGEEDRLGGKRELPVIGGSAQLARYLSFERYPDEKSTPAFRSFVKEIEVDGIRGQLFLSAMDTNVKMGKGEKRGERFYIGLKLDGKDGSLDYYPQIEVHRLLESESEPELADKLHEYKALGYSKEDLRNGGYDLIAQGLKTLEENGYWEDELRRLSDEFERAKRFLDERVTPIVQGRFPHLQGVDSHFYASSKIFLFNRDSTAAGKQPVLRIGLNRGLLEFGYSKAYIIRDEEGVARVDDESYGETSIGEGLPFKTVDFGSVSDEQIEKTLETLGEDFREWGVSFGK